MVDFTIAQANINSGSYNYKGIEKLSATITQAFAALECEQEVLPLDDIEQIDDNGEVEIIKTAAALRFAKRTQADFTVLLVGHMDTVFGAEHTFQHAYIEQELIRGPGVADMKGGITVMLYALKAFELLLHDKKIGWEVLLTPDEEIGSPSSAKIIDAKGRLHDIGFVFEPTVDVAGTLAGTRKGSGKFTLVMQGRAAHAGRQFEYGRNAICALSKVIMEIHGLNNQREGLTLNIGYIKGGGAVNVVADKCICRIDVRFVEPADINWLQKRFDDILAAANRQDDFCLSIFGKFGRKPKIVANRVEQLYNWVRDIGLTIGQDIHWQATGGCCDGNNLAAVGLANIDTLGVRGANIHSDQEYCVIDSLVERAKLLTSILWHLSVKGLR